MADALSFLPPDWVPLERGRVWAAPCFAEPAMKRGWDSLDKVCSPDKGFQARKTPFRITLREELNGLEVFRKINLKGWKGQGIRDRVRTFLFNHLSPAAYEAYWIFTLKEMGFKVPRPLLVGDSGRMSGMCALVTEGIPNARGFVEIPPDELRGYSNVTARLVAGLHGENIFHRDLYLYHFILDGNGDIYLTDFQRMIRPRIMAMRWRVKDLAEMLHSCPDEVPAFSILRFFCYYCIEAGMEEKRRKRILARKVVRKAGRIGRHVPRYG